jgi:hypothetical protein
MTARNLVIGALIAMCAAPAGAAKTAKQRQKEAARLDAQVKAQRARIQQLQAQIRARAKAAPAPAAVAGDEALRPGLSADELRAARGEPDYIARISGKCEIWSYGTTRVTFLNGRITSWQSVARRPAATPKPAGAAHTDAACVDEPRKQPSGRR